MHNNYTAFNLSLDFLINLRKPKEAETKPVIAIVPGYRSSASLENIHAAMKSNTNFTWLIWIFLQSNSIFLSFANSPSFSPVLLFRIL